MSDTEREIDPDRTVRMETNTPEAERTMILPLASSSAMDTATGELKAGKKASSFFSRKKRRDVNIVLDGLEDEKAAREVTFSGAEESLQLLGDSYENREEFAEGGQGILREAFDWKLHRLVAVKSLRPELNGIREQRENFLSEARVTAQLDHPSVVPIYTLNSDADNGLHLAMKFVKGDTLKAYLEKVCTQYRLDGVGAFDEKKALRYRLDIFLKVCDAIEYAHSRHVMHCDLKPSNIMIGEYRETYVMDWGIARKIPDGTEKTPTGTPKQICGTPQYLAPEAIRGERCDQRADIFAMGAILFEVVLLKRAFSGDSIQALLENIRAGNRQPMEHLFGASVDADLMAILRKAMETHREERYAHIGELSGDLRRYLMGLEVSARPDNPLTKAGRWILLHRKLALILILLGLLAWVAGLSFSLYREYRFSEEVRQRDFALGVAYSNCMAAGNLLDEQFSRIELLTDSLAAEAQFLLERTTPKMAPSGAGRAFYSVQELKKTPSPGMMPSLFHKGDIDPSALAYNTTPDTDPATRETRLASLSGLVPRLLQTVLESSTDARVIEADLKTRKAKALEEGTPIIRVLFGFDDGLYLAYPASDGFAEKYDPRQRDWYKIVAPKAAWTTPYVDGVPGIGLVLSYSTPLGLLGKRGNGICSVDVSLYELIEGLHAAGNAGESVREKAIVDRDGRIILSTSRSFADAQLRRFRDPEEKVEFDGLNNPALISAMQERKFGIYHKRAERGESAVYIYTHIHSVNWFYVEKLDFPTLLREARRNAPSAH